MSNDLFGCIALILFFVMAAALISVWVKPDTQIQTRIVKTMAIEL